MVDVTKALEDAALAAQKQNRIVIPPVALPGIGKFQSALVPAMFGGLSLADAVADQPLDTTPEKIIGFDLILPLTSTGLLPEGILPNTAEDEIIFLDPGLYLIFMSINATVAAGDSYVLSVYVNGQPSGIFTAQDLSNQTAFLSAQISGAIALTTGDVVTMYGSSDNVAGSTFIMQNSFMFMSRIR